ncbi:hypothetical protein KGA66_19395 [Actinocrinis puniceicyclus]|uniref:DUF4241 domain-containing protein n=1 Tax=Actinocrinis puniceicyclus TaxID=977794 RepID=A0A8J7WU77_9ACTN|nr:hypothetical protein [Actinocrinis puniceicyclus]MBS2965224.1 hypothetical protein [Actinocrinis puniceicyclus]
MPTVAPHAVLALPTGRLIVADPSALFGDAKPVDLALPPGRYPVVASASGLELRLTDADSDESAGADAGSERGQPVAPGFDTPSGYVCLLDESALEEFTELGDEPVDEYELLAEKLSGQPGRAVSFGGLIVFPVAGNVRALRAGYDRTGRCTRVTAEF